MKAEEEYFENGKFYVSRPQQGCDKCVFKESDLSGCPNFRGKVICTSMSRKDKTSVVWVEVSLLRHLVSEAVK